MSAKKRVKREHLSCPICGRNPVPIKRDRIASHLSPGGVRCIGTSFLAVQAQRFMKARGS